MTQKLVDGALVEMTPEEEADSVAQQAAAAIRHKPQIQADIDFIEQGTLENRGSRELHMRLIEREAQTIADSTGTPVATILGAQPYYQRLKQINDQISALRAELVTAPD